MLSFDGGVRDFPTTTGVSRVMHVLLVFGLATSHSNLFTIHDNYGISAVIVLRNRGFVLPLKDVGNVTSQTTKDFAVGVGEKPRTILGLGVVMGC